MKSAVVKKIKNAPKSPGVYIFYRQRTPIYIGKAANLKNRLCHYPEDQRFVETTNLKIIKLHSPIEALIEESRLIKNLKPELNVYWRDDKNYFYVAFTKDKFPRIFITHRPQSIVKGQMSNVIIGPFTEGNALKLILKILRRHYPYCMCLKPHHRLCLNAQLGLCPGYCCALRSSESEGGLSTDKKKYKENIQIIKVILIGKKKNLLKKIARPEDQWAVENILAHSDYLSGHSDEFGGSDRVKKIECYDASNFAGKEAVGAMTVLVNKNGDWQPDRNQFRLFRVKSAPVRDDPRMIAEILRRRLNHLEWSYPDLIIIDGGITQYNAAKNVLLKAKSYKLKARLISFAKPHKKIYGQSPIPKEIIERAINQTHQYVIAYHRRLRDRIKP